MLMYGYCKVDTLAYTFPSTIKYSCRHNQGQRQVFVSGSPQAGLLYQVAKESKKSEHMGP